MTAPSIRPLDNSSIYIRTKSSTPGYCRYILADNTTEGSISAALKIIDTLIEQNPNLVLLESQKTLADSIREKKYLVVNLDKGAVCLTSKPIADPLFRTKEIDTFSRAVLEEPVSCEKGHTFERNLIEKWVSKKGNICPYQNHNIGTIQIDEDVLEDVERAKAAFHDKEQEREANRQALQSLENRNNANEEVLRNTREELARIQQEGAIQAFLNKGLLLVSNAHLKETTWKVIEGFGGLGKIIFKVSLKAIPVVSLVVGAVMATTRLVRGEGWKKATAEVLSGVAGCFPGAGTVISVAIDAGLIFLDGKELKEKWDPADLDYKKAAELFGFDPKKKLSKNEIESTYRKLSQCTHPDLVRAHGTATEKEFQELQIQVNKAKDILLKRVTK